MRERTILASFYSESEARQAEQLIQELGADVTQVEQLHAYAGAIPERRVFPISGDIPSLASLTLNSEASSRDTGVLMAVDPAASGMTDGQDNVTGRNWLLTVVCPDHLVERAVQIVKAHNGYT